MECLVFSLGFSLMAIYDGIENTVFLFSKCQEDVQEQNNATQISFFCTLLTIKDIGSKLSQQCMNPHITQFLYIIYIIYNILHRIWTKCSSTGLQSQTLGNWWRLLELLCWSKTLRGNLTAPVICFWKFGKAFFPCRLAFVPESSSAGGWTRRRRYGEKTMRLLADAIMAVKLRLISRITNLCTSILLVNWSVWRFGRLYICWWYKC